MKTYFWSVFERPLKTGFTVITNPQIYMRIIIVKTCDWLLAKNSIMVINVHNGGPTIYYQNHSIHTDSKMEPVSGIRYMLA